MVNLVGQVFVLVLQCFQNNHELVIRLTVVFFTSFGGLAMKLRQFADVADLEISPFFDCAQE